MDSKRVLEAALTTLTAVFQIMAAEGGRHAYGFYVVLRLTAAMGWPTGLCGYYSAGLMGWLWAFLAVAVLLNPILPVRMHHADWQPIDLGLASCCWAGQAMHNLYLTTTKVSKCTTSECSRF